MERLNKYHDETMRIYKENGKLHALKYLYEADHKIAQLRSYLNVIEEWIAAKEADLITVDAKEYKALKEENERLKKGIKKFMVDMQRIKLMSDNCINDPLLIKIWDIASTVLSCHNVFDSTTQTQTEK